jgi:hypothetical protein
VSEPGSHERLQGHLEHVSLEGGFWRLRFGGDDAPHGGVVVLGTPDELRAGGFADGDAVVASGYVDEFGATVFMAGTRFVLESIEHADG